MYRWEILNLLISKHRFSSYLEIGVQNRLVNYEKINSFDKYGVDPNPVFGCNYQMTSDEFFSKIPPYVSFDLVFIDGLHLEEHVIKDINNSLARLRPNGIIAVHDCLPIHELHQVRDDHGGEWMGDVWKAIARLRVERRDLHIKTIDTDNGISLIKKRRSEPYTPKKADYLTWEYYVSNKAEIMNIVPPPDMTYFNI
jgi:hypothetical protein